jgi:hypothetical protein
MPANISSGQGFGITRPGRPAAERVQTGGGPVGGGGAETKMVDATSKAIKAGKVKSIKVKMKKGS